MKVRDVDFVAKLTAERDRLLDAQEALFDQIDQFAVPRLEWRMQRMRKHMARIDATLKEEAELKF